ncbi:MAG: type II toxin-antitoxin system death-on-curing family toxin [Candidatus Campbellbacteria bacterium]|nr:type II toxin-antitoxin system death-on-curing family toxin [Candidatus Campbellbacteria bacterium]
MAEVEFTAFALAKELMTWDEPIPDFRTRLPNALESCLDVPFTSFDQKDMYRGLVEKSTMLFYLMIKNHPFQNGNKRVAIMTLLVFLAHNNKWIKMDQNDLYNFAVGIAKSRPTSREKVLQNIRVTIKKYLINFIQ